MGQDITPVPFNTQGFLEKVEFAKVGLSMGEKIMPVKVKRAQTVHSVSLGSDPHRVLGLHEEAGAKVIRLWRPGAPYVYVELFGKKVEAKRTSQEGLFAVDAPLETTFRDYRVYSQNGVLHH